jgi:molybdopterin-synthase adenylyltransferase
MKSDRYLRQILFPPIGRSGQGKIGMASVALIGCGALGSASADSLVRAGVGRLVLVDRDYIELNNLQRQSLFDEKDIEERLPKAIAAARKLSLINSEVLIEPHVSDVTAGNIEKLAGGCDLVVDATDNFETRYLVNDFAVQQNKPWIYGACVASEGLILPILPGQTPCLRCVFPDPPAPGSTPTCDTAGILASIVHIVSSFQVVEALKILSGNVEEVQPILKSIDCWKGTFRSMDVSKMGPSPQCPACGQKRFEYLNHSREAKTVALCGREAYHVYPGGQTQIPLEKLAKRLAPVGTVQGSEFLLQVEIGDRLLTLFADGRAIIRGVKSGKEARTFYARYVGL